MSDGASRLFAGFAARYDAQRNRGDVSLSHNDLKVKLMDVTLAKKTLYAVVGCMMATAFSSEAKAAWTDLPVPSSYASTVSSVRVCKAPATVPVIGAAWRVTAEVTRSTPVISGVSLLARRVVGTSLVLVSAKLSTTWTGGTVNMVTVFGSQTADDRYTLILNSLAIPAYVYPLLTPSQIADC
jgi:hypothetical protein